MKPNIIQIRDVSLKTCSVEVKSLTLNGKQMTLSVFRQLYRWHFFDRETLEIPAGAVPWGLINYFWKDVEGRFHVVFSLNGHLYRDLVSFKDLQAANEQYARYDVRRETEKLQSELDYSQRMVDRWTSIDDQRNLPAALDRLDAAKHAAAQAYAGHPTILRDAIERDAAEKNLLHSLASLPQLLIAI